MDTKEALSDVLQVLFRDITETENKAVRSPELPDVTSNDMHVIEAIGIGEHKNMSAIASELGVTMGTLTIAVNSLVKKGYVTRERSNFDKRVVLASLSPKGRKAYEYHKQYHKDLVDAITSQLSDVEQNQLLDTLTKLNEWFRIRLTDNEENVI